MTQKRITWFYKRDSLGWIAMVFLNYSNQRNQSPKPISSYLPWRLMGDKMPPFTVWKDCDHCNIVGAYVSRLQEVINLEYLRGRRIFLKCLIESIIFYSNLKYKGFYPYNHIIIIPYIITAVFCLCSWVGSA